MIIVFLTGIVNINGEIWNYIPVARYGAGMSGGCIIMKKARNIEMGDTEYKFCGTFYYYYKPESTTYLAYTTSRTCFNKIDALIKMGMNSMMNISMIIYISKLVVHIYT